MVHGGRFLLAKHRGHQNRELDEYMLMLRAADWKLSRKTDALRSFIPDTYVFPPFQHITLYGPFVMMPEKSITSVYSAIESASEWIPGISFDLAGYLRLKGMRGDAVTHRVLPSRDLALFHNRLWHSLSTLVKSRSWIDQDPLTRKFHITHAYNLRPCFADLICNTVQACIAMYGDDNHKEVSLNNCCRDITLHAGKPIILPEYAQITSYRVIVLKNGVIDREFDLPSREWLSRPLVFNPKRTAVSLLQYRKITGLELASSPEPRENPPYVISDLHLGHNNIIRYCRRPFNNSGEMDRVLVGNWNRTVGEHDEILYLGDFRYSSEAAPFDEYIHHLNGRVRFIRGNHDGDIPDTIPSLSTWYQGTEYLFIHNPGQAPPGFQGWVIHGHHHNNDMRRFPFINFDAKRVNVSCELTAYRPVSLETIRLLIEKHSGQGKNIGSLPDVVPKPGLSRENSEI